MCLVVCSHIFCADDLCDAFPRIYRYSVFSVESKHLLVFSIPPLSFLTVCQQPPFQICITCNLTWFVLLWISHFCIWQLQSICWSITNPAHILDCLLECPQALHLFYHQNYLNMTFKTVKMDLDHVWQVQWKDRVWFMGSCSLYLFIKYSYFFIYWTKTCSLWF